ncbi:MAG: type II secretion system F family protein [Candidatus Omnitrophica bacterium]|nr:type II secretion system F family protein [Candidatus Omnitrophota bacterium]
MAIFKYRAKKGPGNIVESQLIAASRDEAIERINQLGYVPVRVEEVQSGTVSSGARFAGIVRAVKGKHVTVFTRQLAILLKSGVPILKAMTILADQSLNPYFKTVLETVRSEIKNGKTLSSALALFPQLFSPLYLSLVRAGEESGTLDQALLRIAEYRFKQEQMFSQVRTALTYPVLMAIVGIGTIIFMLTFVMPRLLTIFSRVGQELPLPTKILIGVSNFLTQPWVWFVSGGVILLAVGVLRRHNRTKRERLLMSYVQLHVPLFGEIFLRAELARFSRTLELLLISGIQLLKAIQISIPTLNNEIIRNELQHVYEVIEQGGSFGQTLNRSAVFPKFMVNLVSVGEESGKLEEALQELTLTYESETDEAVKVMTNLLEPLMILGMGIVVGFIIISMLLPVFQLNMMVQ